MSQLPSWELFATFLAVMRDGSLSAAARELAVSQPTVRRHIEELELGIGVRLFTRSPSGLSPTDAALSIFPQAQSMESTYAAMIRTARSDGNVVSGPVRITASEIMAVHVLPTVLAPLLRDNPALSIELVASNQVDDLLNRDADIAVRMVRPRQSAIVARKVGEVAIGLFAAPSYFEGRPPVNADTMTVHRYVGEDRLKYQEAIFAQAGIDSAKLTYAFRSDSDMAQLAAVASGIGVGACHRTELAGRFGLVSVLSHLDTRLDIWLATHADLRDQPRIRSVLEYLGHRLSAYAKGQQLS